MAAIVPSSYAIKHLGRASKKIRHSCQLISHLNVYVINAETINTTINFMRRLQMINAYRALPLILLLLISSACAANPPARSYKPQPAMESALYHLKLAERRLLSASPTKGGHRWRALQALRVAIRQTQLGIRFDDHHHKH